MRQRRGGLLLPLVTTSVVVALVFYGGGGWYFSGQVISDVLKVDYPGTSYVDRVRELDVPQLVLHGTEDCRIPVEVSPRLSEGSNSIELVEFEGAEHVESWNLDRERYERELRSFLDRVRRAAG